MSSNDKKDLIHEVNVVASLYNFDTDTKKDSGEHGHSFDESIERELSDISHLYNLENK